MLVRQLKASAEKPGFYRVIWDGRDDKGNKVPNGIYFYRLSAGEFKAIKKMVKME
ncbi:MAG: FlgD immunoglobulin-like domain containing protein [bacterium]